ncbi:hypothetical protein [Dipodfec virus UOA04_Rod_1109]|nr:hypothetical protein [Dipodfec virus UOA04_Rod_1109]
MSLLPLCVRSYGSAVYKVSAWPASAEREQHVAGGVYILDIICIIDTALFFNKLRCVSVKAMGGRPHTIINSKICFFKMFVYLCKCVT